MLNNYLLDALEKPRAINFKPPSQPKPAKPIAQSFAPLKIKERSVWVKCEIHGDEEIHQKQLESIDFPDAKCRECEKIAEVEERAKWEAQHQQEVVQRKQERIEYAIGRAAIPLRFKTRTLAAYLPDNEKSRELKAVCEKYVAEFEENKSVGRSIIFSGRAGTGKTHLACGIAMEIIRSGGSALYTTAGGAFRMVKDTFNTKQTETEVIEKFTAPDFLVIDEIGVQYGSDTEKNILFDIINTRYERMKPTMVLSNLTAKELIDYAGERVIDRLRENGGIVRVLDWESKRK
jgi:DNA replication protein DnaC